ncbi:hypothetical protein [Ruegeria arenilitoris]|uniref:hypothetical protein n=1 Tax=Ruegeria arenilitoris TaxID=1173585 RepID=UPI00147D4F52|nr:hypothetical protein [Ruegeria arenilitoris]
MVKLIDARTVMDDLPKKVRKTRAKMRAELLAEGKSSTDAHRITEQAHKRAYKVWLRDFAETHPHLEGTARMMLKREGLIQ